MSGTKHCYCKSASSLSSSNRHAWLSVCKTLNSRARTSRLRRCSLACQANWITTLHEPEPEHDIDMNMDMSTNEVTLDRPEADCRPMKFPVGASRYLKNSL